MCNCMSDAEPTVSQRYTNGVGDSDFNIYGESEWAIQKAQEEARRKYGNTDYSVGGSGGTIDYSAPKVEQPIDYKVPSGEKSGGTSVSLGPNYEERVSAAIPNLTPTTTQTNNLSTFFSKNKTLLLIGGGAIAAFFVYKRMKK